MEVAVLYCILFFISVGFLPTYIAFGNNHPQKAAIFILNFFLGWTLIGWIIALCWAFVKNEPSQVIVQNPQKTTSAADELLKLTELMEKGIITQEEFNRKKSQILNS